MSVNKVALWNKSFILLFIANFFMWFGVAFLMPTMPLFALHLGAAQSQIGYLVGGFGVASLFIRPFAGYAYDNYSKKLIMVIFLAAFSLLLFLYPLAASFFALLCFRTVHGLIFGVASTGGSAIIADVVHPSRRSEGIGIYGLGNTLAMSVGPAIGLWIMVNYGYAAMFIGCGFFIALSSLLPVFIQCPVICTEKKKFSLKTAIEKRVLSVSFIVIFVGLIFGGLSTFVIIFSKEIGIANGGIYFFLNSIGVAVTRFFAGKIQDRRGPKPVLTFGLWVLIAGLVLLAITKNIYMFSAAAIVIGVGMGTIWPALQTMAINMVEPGRRGVALSTFGAAIDIGIAAGAIVLGWIAAWTSLPGMYLISAALVLIPVALFKFYVYKDYLRSVARLEASGLNEIQIRV